VGASRQPGELVAEVFEGGAHSRQRAQALQLIAGDQAGLQLLEREPPSGTRNVGAAGVFREPLLENLQRLGALAGLGALAIAAAVNVVIEPVGSKVARGMFRVARKEHAAGATLASCQAFRSE
jgi:hypothetical protein